MYSENFTAWLATLVMEILMSAVNGRTDRDDINLQELVFAGKLKLALAHIEKRLKKGKHDALLVFQCLDCSLLRLIDCLG